MSVIKAFDIVVLPWLELKEPIQVGEVTFRPADSDTVMESARCDEVAETVNRYLRCFVDHNQQPINMPVVAILGPNNEFRALSDDEFLTIRLAIDALAFATIAGGTLAALRMMNTSVAPPSSECLEVFAHRLMSGQRDLSVRSGISLHGGCSMDSVRFQMPWCVGGTLLAKPDSKFVEAFSILARRPQRFPKLMSLRLAIETFRLAYVSSDFVSNGTSVVLMTTAFEQLLDCGMGSRKAMPIARRVDRFCGSENHLRDFKEGESLSLVGCWMYDFYKLRNDVVHGNDVEPHRFFVAADDMAIDQRYVSAVVFAECVARMLDKRNLIPKTRAGDLLGKLNERPDEATVALAKEFESRSLEWCFRFDEIHRSLGWMPPSEPSIERSTSYECDAISDKELDDLLGTNFAEEAVDD